MVQDRLTLVFSALADPTRRDIVARLAVGDATVNQLAAPYDVTVQAVSKHIRVLQDAGLVSRSRDAQRRPVH
ncbi:MAG: metalloregulator ArsR/SmtB family transcription factor, partial [Microlunatus sp.]|nr:metalloregulator ArsR/SmtB family transcription factor [Microlunatus sp.]